MNILQHIALKWYKTIDGANGTLYNMLKELHISIRVIFYISLPLIILFSFKAGEQVLPLNGFEALYNIIGYLTAFGASLVFTYESIYNLNVRAILEHQKTTQDYIKKNKLQKWRLRNMSYIKRILVYIVSYILLISMLQFFISVAFIQTYPSPTIQQLEMLNASYNEFLGYLSICFITIALILEYFTHQKQRIKNV